MKIDFGKPYRHKKTGNVYIPLFLCVHKTDLIDTDVVVYCSEDADKAKFYTRTIEDFVNKFEIFNYDKRVNI